MSDIAIRVEHLSKRYRIGQYVGSGAQYKTLRESLADAVSAPLRRLRRAQVRSKQQGANSKLIPNTQHPTPNIIWALKDVSFEVKHGEVLGIIGRNGAGKSTLLKVLTRITEPTEGRAELNGRVGSLLEVGTGFHPELTGRENVRLSGAILGMTRKEIDRKFDEIVDFSGIEKFIDTPVKRYSSGMSVRLGFAVAAHLEPEILLIDEVLAVGDAAFQKKCLGKMGEVGTEGRTVLFVSHNMAALTNLCQRAILLDLGRVRGDGAASEVVQDYISTIEESGSIPLDDRQDRFDGTRLRITHVSLADTEGEPVDCLRSGEGGQIILHYRSPTKEKFRNVFVRIYIESIWGQRLCAFETASTAANFAEIGPAGKFVCAIPRVPLQAGTYPFWVYVNAEGNCLDEVRNAGRIRVEAGDFFGYGKNPSVGHVLVDHSWQYLADGEMDMNLTGQSQQTRRLAADR